MGNTGAAIAVVGAALVLVFLVNKQRAATTAAQLSLIQGTIFDPNKPLSFSDQVNGAVIAVSTYFGGAGAGIAAAKQVH